MGFRFLTPFFSEAAVPIKLFLIFIPLNYSKSKRFIQIVNKCKVVTNIKSCFQKKIVAHPYFCISNRLIFDKEIKKKLQLTNLYIYLLSYNIKIKLSNQICDLYYFNQQISRYKAAYSNIFFRYTCSQTCNQA
jgi:hypothetical protein